MTYPPTTPLHCSSWALFAKGPNRPVPDDGGKVVPIARNSLGTLGEREVLYAYCRRCKRDRPLNVPALSGDTAI